MNTNIMLKKMMKNTARYQRRSLASKLAVNIETCEPILNPKMTKENKENLFVYLNKQFRIIGFLKGYEILKDYNDYYAQYTEYPKNRKNLLANAEYVLMFTPEMRQCKIKSNKDIVEKTQTLQDRLHEYKANKYKNISNEEMQIMIQSILSELNNDIFTNKLPKQFKKLAGYSGVTTTLISRFAQLVQEFNWRVLDIEREVKYYKDQGKDVNVEHLYAYQFYIKAKNEILYWNKLLMSK